MNSIKFLFYYISDFLKSIKYNKIGKFAYKFFLRKFISLHINDPNKKWDNYMMEALDEIFDYRVG